MSNEDVSFSFILVLQIVFEIEMASFELLMHTRTTLLKLLEMDLTCRDNFSIGLIFAKISIFSGCPIQAINTS